MGVRIERVENTMERLRQLRRDCAELFPLDKKLEFSLLVVEMLYDEAKQKDAQYG